MKNMNPRKDHGKFAKFNPNVKNEQLSDISIREVKKSDYKEIAKIVWERDEKKGLISDYNERFKKEFKKLGSANWYMHVAIHENKIVGYGRLVKITEVIGIPGPLGWYLMGITVSHNYRRKGIGEKLTKFRLEFAAKLCSEIYFVCNAQNETSIYIHEKLGFQKILKGKGFFNILFDQGLGYIYRKNF